MYTKTITPAFETKKNGVSKKLTGYLGELRDGETLIHSMEYGTYHDAEVALDALAFDLMSRTPQAEAEPASTCCFCHKPNSPQSCSEMRALLFAPDAAAVVAQMRSDHEQSLLDDPAYRTIICDAKTGAITYEMPRCATCGGDGDCPDCGKCETCGGDGRIPAYGTGDQAGGYAETCPDCNGKGTFISAPLDLDFAPCGPEV